MDKANALAISRNYLRRLRDTNLSFSGAWLFGSYAKGNQRDDSDIDIAVLLNDDAPISFETEVKFMTCRTDEETLIEPHIFLKSDFDESEPLVEQILTFGEPIYL